MENKTIIMMRGAEFAHVYQRPSRTKSTHAAIGVEVFNPDFGGYTPVLQTLLPIADTLGLFWEFNRMLCKASQAGFELSSKYDCKYECNEVVE